MRVFIDTGFFYARISVRDQWHRFAVRQTFPPAGAVTSALVVTETASLLQLRGFYATALEFLQEIRSAGDVEIVHTDAALQAEAWDLFARYGSAGATIVDCASFAVMRRLHIRRAYTFDRHFEAAGFQILGR